jgi:hypothetical protein
MSNIIKPRILITGATGQVMARQSIIYCQIHPWEIMAAVRTHWKSGAVYRERGIETVFLIMMMKVHISPAFKTSIVFYGNCSYS